MPLPDHHDYAELPWPADTTDVVVGLIETYGRAHTTEQVEGLEVLGALLPFGDLRVHAGDSCFVFYEVLLNLDCIQLLGNRS